MSPLTRRQFIGAAAGVALTTNVPAARAHSLEINPRESWASGLDPLGPLDAEDVRFLLVHHSASFNGHSASQVPNILRGWFNFHTGSRGWNDIAYNFIIDSEGGIWEGRKGSLAGAVAGDATGGNQGYSQLVCVIGDTNLQPATAAAHQSLVATLSWLADRYDVPTTSGSQVSFVSRGSNKWPSGTEVTTPTIAGHRDMSNTSCPGDSLYSYVAGDLMEDVQAARSPTTTTSPTTTSTSTTTTSTSTSTTTTSTTTTVPPTTTTTAPSTTTSTSIPTTTTTTQVVDSVPTSVAEAAAEADASTGLPTGIAAIATSLVLGGAAFLAWRARRIG